MVVFLQLARSRCVESRTSAIINCRLGFSTMKDVRCAEILAGVFFPMKKSRLFSTSPIDPTETLHEADVPSPMNWPNSFGLISPSP